MHDTEIEEVDLANNSAVTLNKKKVVYLEALRVFSIFFVVFNHTGSAGYALFTERKPGSIGFWVDLSASVFCTFAVPMFLFISGAVMLGKKDEPLEKQVKRIGKMLVLLVLYSLIYYCYGNMGNAETGFSLSEFFTLLYSKSLCYHLWYLYLYVAYLIALPFLRSIVSNLNSKYFYYLLALAAFFTGILPCAEYIASKGTITMYANLKPSWLFNTALLYPCLGWYFYNKTDNRTIQRLIPVFWVINIATIFLSCYMTYMKGIDTGVFSEAESQTFLRNFAIINCISIFITAKYLSGKIGSHPKAEKYIVYLGRCTLGVYLLHPLIKNLPFTVSLIESLNDLHMGGLVTSVLITLLIGCLTYIVVIILSQIPIIRKAVGF